MISMLKWKELTEQGYKDGINLSETSFDDFPF